MQYLGGKSRVAKPIAEILIAAKGSDRTTYVEPFLGGGSVAALVAPHFDQAYLSDASRDLMQLWRAILDGWKPPGNISEEVWRDLKHSPPSPLRGLAGYGCSFGGRWFEGYARDPRKTKTFAQTAARGLRRKAKGLAGAKLRVVDYREMGDVVNCRSVVYCDPPYAGTKTYGAVPPFDHDAFWRTAARWSRMSHAKVFVSEYAAPDPWVSVWSARPPSTVGGGTRGTVTEHLFTLPDAA